MTTTEADREPLELLALAGIAAPLILTNVSYRTRDALLLYNTLRLTLDIASLRRVPTGSARTIYELTRTWGIDGRLLHDIESEPLVLSEINGQWGLARRGGLVTIAALVSSRSDLEEATTLVLRLAALLGSANIVLSALGVTAALWRAKRHESYSWLDRVNEVERLDRPDSTVTAALDNARKEAAARLEHSPTPNDEKVCQGLALRARLLSVSLLVAVPVAYFEASGPAASVVALLASPNFKNSNDLLVAGLVLRVLYSLGLDGALSAELVRLTKRADGNGGQAFRGEFLALNWALRSKVKRTGATEGALVALRRHGHRAPGVVADLSVLSSGPVARLETALESLSRAIPRGDDERRTLDIATHDAAFPPLSEHDSAAVKGLNLESAALSAALSAARAGAGALHLLTKGHAAAPTASKG